MSSARTPPGDKDDSVSHGSPKLDNSLDSKGEFPMAPEEYFFYLLFLAARRRDLHFERTLAEAGLNLTRWRTLAIIRRIAACTMKDLALYSTVDRTTLTRSVDQLVEKQLVERMTPRGDRRKVSLALSPAGEELYSRAVVLLMSSNAGLLDGVSEATIRGANRLLQTMVRRTALDEREAEDLLKFRRAR